VAAFKLGRKEGSEGDRNSPSRGRPIAARYDLLTVICSISKPVMASTFPLLVLCLSLKTWNGRLAMLVRFIGLGTEQLLFTLDKASSPKSALG